MIYFRHKYTVVDLHIALKPGEEISFEWRDKSEVRASFRTELVDEPKRTEMVGSISTSDDPNSELMTMFKELERGEMPSGSRSLEEAKAASLGITGSFSPPFDQYPVVLQEYLGAIHVFLSDSFRRLLGLIAWRSGAYGAPSFRSSSAAWSFDASIWTPLAQRRGGSVSIMAIPNITDQIRTSVQTLMQEGAEQSASQELLREAWQLRNTNPRSALLLGMASIEVGLKECISELIPDAEWLAFHAPSPPLATMLKQFVPLLPVKAGIAAAPLKSMMHVLDDAVMERNGLAHQRAFDLSRQEIAEVLDVARELLLQFDLYRGHAWAAKIQPRIRS
ncbi:MAG: hypothetical protein ACYDCS_07155 [Candidatus Dormibacteria bacterium]